MSDQIEVPPYFLCPIALQIMKDPVTVSTGITYDRDSIEKWIFSQNKTTCPVTNQLLLNSELTPNITLRRLIQSWCTLNASESIERLPTPKSPITESQITKILDDAKKSPQMMMSSLTKLKSIASQNQTNKRIMESSGTGEFLASLLVEKTLEASRTDVSEDVFESSQACDEALTILYNLKLSESSLKSIGKVEFIESLTSIMQFGSYESRVYAIMLLKSMFKVLSSFDLRPEFFIQCTQILSDEVSQKASKTTLKVLIATCPYGRNKIKAVESGLVPLIIDLLLDSSDKSSIEMMLIVLDLLCQCAEGRSELLKHSAGLAVVSKKILRVSQVASERGIKILHSISKFSATNGVLQEMLIVGVVSKLCLVLQVDCGLKIKERAREMLKVHARVWRNSPCVPNNLIASYPSR